MTTTTTPPDHFPDATKMVSALEDDVKPIRDALADYSQWAGRPTVLENALAHIDAQAVRLEAADRDASERAKAQATRICDDFERLGAINRSKWVSTNHGKWEGMAIAYEQAALKCRRAAIASEAKP